MAIGMGLPFKTSSFLALVEICILLSLKNLVIEANLCGDSEEMFASSWVGKQKSCCKWIVKN